MARSRSPNRSSPRSGSKLYAVDVRPGSTFEFGTPKSLFDLSADVLTVRNSYVPGFDGQKFLVNKLLDSVGTEPIDVIVDWAAK